MTIKTILVGASGGTASDGAIELACHIARRFDAHLEGFHVRLDPQQLVIVAGAGGFNMPIDSSWVDQMAADAEATAATTKTAFTTALARHGLKMAEAPPLVRPSVAWCDETGYAPLLVAHRARFFDLVVLGRSERVIEQSHTGTVEEVLIHSGRPVLLAPAHPHATIGSTIAVAWNGSPQAVRALAATLPLLTAARAVTIVTVGGEYEESATSVKQYLGWHGISGSIRHVSRLSGTGPDGRLQPHTLARVAVRRRHARSRQRNLSTRFDLALKTGRPLTRKRNRRARARDSWKRFARLHEGDYLAIEESPGAPIRTARHRRRTGQQ
jgi:nucleotide-binding universal stress UspA family protein